MTTEISDSKPPLPLTLIDVQEVARLLACSTRHVYRMSDAGRMPPPLKLGALVRWNRAVLDAWITAGCKSVRSSPTNRQTP